MADRQHTVTLADGGNAATLRWRRPGRTRRVDDHDRRHLPGRPGADHIRGACWTWLVAADSILDRTESIRQDVVGGHIVRGALRADCDDRRGGRPGRRARRVLVTFR